MYREIHDCVNGLTRHSFSGLDKVSSIKNGIYLCFEKGERFEGMNRIVRVGSHPSNGRFYGRLRDHFLKKHRGSIMRKHIGRCLLNQEKDEYLKVWDYTNKKVKRGSPLRSHLDLEKEDLIEERVSDLLRNFSFVVIPHLDDHQYRLELEAKLIATLNKQGIGSSPSWLGSSHPDERIRKSGLWNIQHLNFHEQLSTRDFENLQKLSQ